jgi:O-antigen ligase
MNTAASHQTPDLGSSDRRLFYALVALLVWVPLPLGSNRPWSQALMELGIFALAGLWLGLALRGRVGPTAAWSHARWPLIALIGWLLYGLLQVLPLPFAWLTVLSPKAAQQWLETALALTGGPPPTYATLSLDPHASLVSWRLGLALISLFVLILVLVRSRRRLRILASTLVLAAVVQAMLAGWLTLAGEPFLFIAAIGRAHGTFANPNHLAGFLEMSIALGIGLLIADLAQPNRRMTWRQRLRAWTRTLLGPKARLRIYLAILVSTLVMTASRMGNTAFFSSLAIAGLIGVMSFRRSPRPVLILLFSLVLVDLLILGSWFGLDRVRERLEQTVWTEDARYQIGVRATRYLEDYPWLGSGGGSFSSVYPAYRNAESIPLHFAHAENDLLELQLEYGIIGMLPLVAGVVLSLGAALRVLWSRRDALSRGMAFASLMGVTAILIHSTADANLHIPANAALFMVLLALPWLGLAIGHEDEPVQPEHGGQRAEVPRRPDIRGPRSGAPAATPSRRHRATTSARTRVHPGQSAP